MVSQPNRWIVTVEHCDARIDDALKDVWQPLLDLKRKRGGERAIMGNLGDVRRLMKDTVKKNDFCNVCEKTVKNIQILRLENDRLGIDTYVLPMFAFFEGTNLPVRIATESTYSALRYIMR